MPLAETVAKWQRFQYRDLEQDLARTVVLVVSAPTTRLVSVL